MANKRPPWKIPDVINPPLRRCIKIDVPDDPDHLAILWGQLRALSDWQRWEREPTKSGTLVAQVWRDVVYSIDWSNMSCCPEPTNRRYNAEGVLEVSYDNGATWVVDNSLDDRYSGIIAPPMAGADGSEKACIAATSAQEFIKANLIDSLTDGQTYAEINAALVAVVAALGVTGIGILLAAAVAAIFLAGVTAIQAAFTSEVWADFRCILNCRIEDDGSFTAEGWEAVKADILSTFTGAVSAILYNWTNSVGLVGLTNAARSGFAAAGDCSDCDCGEWCYSFDFTASDQGWSVRNIAEFGDIGRYVAATGFKQRADYTAVDNITIMSPVIASTKITRVDIAYDPALTGDNPKTDLYLEGFGTATATAAGGALISFTGLSVFSTQIAMDADPDAGDIQEWTGSITTITVYGEGVNPFGADNCV